MERCSGISNTAPGNQSLQRGLAIVETLADAAPGLGIRDLARRAGLAPAIVQRLVNTLAAGAWLDQDPATRRYRLGPRLIALSHRLDPRERLVQGAREALAPLAARGLNGYLGALRGAQAVYLLSVQSSGPIAIRSGPGDLAHLHTTAMGKVLLAALPEARAAALLGAGPLAAPTSRSLTNPADVLATLPAIRAAGFALVEGENLDGVTSVGVPVYDARGAVLAALSVAWLPAAAPEEVPDAVIRDLRAAAQAVSRVLGAQA
jgi:DNA-binding IclR family transcriptional regulator